MRTMRDGPEADVRGMTWQLEQLRDLEDGLR